MTTEYSTAHAVAAIAETLIDQHHKHLVGVRIVYVFRDKAAKSKGREVWGTARVVTGLNAFLASTTGQMQLDTVTFDLDGNAEPFGVVEIARDVWLRIDDKKRRALVDHELSHLKWMEGKDEDDDGRLVVVGHDLEEFRAIVERHGLWRDDVIEFADSVQLALELQA